MGSKFDLEKALAGAKVITRDGREVTQLTRFDIYGNYPLIGVINKQKETFQINGKFQDSGESTADLFMAPEKISCWVNVYLHKSLAGHVEKIGIRTYTTKENALKFTEVNSRFYTYIKTIEITNEP